MVKISGNKTQVQKKDLGKQKTFQEEGHNQGGKKMPMTLKQEYGTGLKEKKPSPPLAKKKAVGKGK